MRIKRIEVIGFKSFCDRSVLHFGEPIVGVVGPNGCGKSNIVDAIRWCMGEQSAKHLRGQAMGDVVFAGSDTRGPAGMAEVSLTFEDVGFSHETLQLALSDEESMGDPILGSDAEELEEAAEEAAEVAPDAMQGDATLAEGQRELDADLVTDTATDQEPTLEAQATAESDVSAEAQPSLSGDGPTGAGPDSEMAEPVQPAPDPYQATREAAELLADKPPAIDYAKYSEVTITRRLFRDGTSQYFLNKVPCRLRDITDFFLGTGVGTKAYSIIEQGRIGMIVSARANDRRHIIEEAAGITKFKTKKRAAERKLEQTRQNLLRVSDIVSELGKRLGTLRRQAQKAERYRRYKSEVRDIELWKASHKFLELAANEKTLQASLAEISESLEAGRAKLSTMDARVVAERAELAVEERRLSGLQEQIFELENRIRLSESQSEFQKREATELEQRCATAVQEIEVLTSQRDEAALDHERQNADLTALSETVAHEEASTAERERAFSEARQMLKDAQSALEQARASLGEARADLARSESSTESIGGRVGDVRARLDKVLAETGEADARVKERESSVKGIKTQLAGLVQTRLDLGNKAEEFTARKAQLDDSLHECEASVETLRTELHRRKSRLQSLREIHDKYEGFARGTRAVMQNSDSLVSSMQGFEIRGLVADVVDAPQPLEVAVEAALGDRLGGILVNKAEVGARAIEFLKETSAGRSAFVPFRPPTASVEAIEFEDRSGASAIPTGRGVLGPMIDLVQFDDGYRDMAKTLLGGTIVVESLSCALELRESGVRQTLVTLDGDIVDERGVVIGGSRESQGASVLAQKREIRELSEIVTGLEGDLTEATARFVSTKAELIQVTKALEGLRAERHDGELAITAHEKDLSGAHVELERLRERLTSLNSEQLDLEFRLEALEREELIMKELHDSAALRIERLEREQLGLIEGVEQGHSRVDDLGHSLTEAKIRVAQLGEKRASLEASTLRLERTRVELSERINKLAESIETDGDRARSLREQADGLAVELEGHREQRRAQAEALESSRRLYEERVAAVDVAEVEVRGLRSETDKLARDASALEVKISNLVSDRRHLSEAIEDRYHVILPKVVGDFHLRPVITREDEERLQQRRGIIERMGSDINLTAIEEFEEISQRHEFLSTQQKDLESAVGQLDAAISKINKTSRSLFKEAFDAINAKFQEMFPKLFRGGRARLQLTGGDEVDLLEAGVEIHAQPPGKKNTTVDQLSGGEKALTAVALLFAIFLIKPSPFCLLDEVDAPLDEANVDRYNEILREMTQHSQFIVITHNKRTMAVADRLYGVTMQEPGVSKLVTVNLNRVGSSSAAA